MNKFRRSKYEQPNKNSLSVKLTLTKLILRCKIRTSENQKIPLSFKRTPEPNTKDVLSFKSWLNQHPNNIIFFHTL